MNKQEELKLILCYLKEMGRITAREAAQLCGCRNLDAHIRVLRGMGIPIREENHIQKTMTGYRRSYKIYLLEGQKC